MFTSRKKSIGIAVGLAAAGILLAPSAASAHVSVTPDAAPEAGSTLDLTFGVGHGCDGSATTALRIELPSEGIAGPKPIVQSGWDIDIEHDGEAGQPSAVTFTPDEPVADETRAEVRLNLGILSDATGQLVFPVEQTCEDGSESWDQVAQDGQDPHDLELPAPALEVQQVTDGDAESAEGAHAAHADGADDAAAATDGQDALPVVLGGAGLVAGVAALVVSMVALRRRA